MVRAFIHILFVLGLLTAPATADVGYSIGSYDPGTEAYRDAVMQAMRMLGLKTAYITVNHATDKDFNASMQERIDMLEFLFEGDLDKVRVDPVTARN